MRRRRHSHTCAWSGVPDTAHANAVSRSAAALARCSASDVQSAETPPAEPPEAGAGGERIFAMADASRIRARPLLYPIDLACFCASSRPLIAPCRSPTPKRTRAAYKLHASSHAARLSPLAREMA